MNAIQAASNAISKLKLGRLDKETTANVGVINGGIIRNGVPKTVSFLAECRGLDHKKAQALAVEMKMIITDEVEIYGANADVEIDNLCKAVSIPENSWTVEASKKALHKPDLQMHQFIITTELKWL
ncbi:MAG: peptidase dimerization domain-containing protein [Candidatus Bathyarchaeota archaeon]